MCVYDKNVILKTLKKGEMEIKKLVRKFPSEIWFTNGTQANRNKRHR